jgi:hypothetical protein
MGRLQSSILERLVVPIMILATIALLRPSLTGFQNPFNEGSRLSIPLTAATSPRA